MIATRNSDSFTTVLEDGTIITSATSGGYNLEIDKARYEYLSEREELKDIEDQARKKAKVIQSKKSLNSRNRVKSFKPNVRSSNTYRRS